MFLISLAIIASTGEFPPFSFVSLFMIYVVLKVFLVIIKGLFKRQNLYYCTLLAKYMLYYFCQKNYRE